MTRVALVLCLALGASTLLTAKTASAEQNPFVESIGALAAAQLYTTASYLDVTKEALVRKAFQAKAVRSDLERLGKMTDNVGRYLLKVVAAPITPEDKAFIEEGIAIYGLLKTESLALHRYAGTLAAADLTAFDTARAASWERLKKLLKLP